MADNNPYAQYVAEDNPYSQYALPKPKMHKIGAEGLGDAMQEVGRYTHPLGQLLGGGIGFGLDDLSTRAGQLWAYANRGGMNAAAPELTPQQATDLQAHRSLYQDSPMALLGNIGTGMLLTGPLAGAGYAAGKTAASVALPQALQFLAPTAGAAGVGAGTAALTQPTLPGESTVQNAAHGGIAGALADTVLRGGSRLVQPITQSPAVQKLLNYDIVPTLGSAAGGVMKSVEDKLSSLPFVGEIIKNRQIGARNELNAASLKLGTPPGQEVTAIGREGIEQGKDAFGRAYGEVYKGSQIGLDKVLKQDLDAAKNSTTIPLSGEEVSQFDKIVKREVFDRLSMGPVPTDDAKKVIEANLGKAASKAEGPLQDALKEAKNAFRSAMGRSVGPDGAQELKAIDKAYSNFADVKKAAQAAEGGGGVATPRQLQRAAKPGELKSLANAAQETLPPSIPNSGSTDRALMNWLLLSGGAMGANEAGGRAMGHEGPVINHSLLAAMLLSPALYSRAGSRYMLGDLIPGQPALSQAMQQTAPYAAQAGALYAPYR